MEINELKQAIFDNKNLLMLQRDLYIDLINWSLEQEINEDKIANYASNVITRKNNKMLPLEKLYFKRASEHFINEYMPAMDETLKAALPEVAQRVFENIYSYDLSRVEIFYNAAAQNLNAIASRGFLHSDYTVKPAFTSGKEGALEHVFRYHTVENTYSKMLAGWECFERNIQAKTKRKEEKKEMKKANSKMRKGAYDLDKIKQAIRIEDYARDLGFTILRVGSYLTLAEHDSVRIDPQLNRFWRNSTGASGTVIDFGVEFENKPQNQVIKVLWSKVDPNFVPSDKKIEKQKEPFRLVLNAPNMDKAVSYLKSRCIADEVIQDIIERKMIYESYKHECVFIGYNENRLASWGYLRGTGGQKFYAEIKGSDEKVGYYIHNQAPVTVITEGCIDLLSYMTLQLKEGKNLKNANYLALGSCKKINTAIANFETYHPDKMIIALDNDNAGQMAGLKLKQKLQDVGCKAIEFSFSDLKDWNDDLCKRAENKILQNSTKMEMNFRM